MSKINQIQNKLRELDGGKFQKLAESYLYKKGYKRIYALGSVVGKDKTRKGTPDIFIPTTDGKYVFVEATTQQDRILEKIKNDIAKCVDHSKAGVPIERIENIIFCLTFDLKIFELEELRKISQLYQVNIVDFGISQIAHDLQHSFPGIAKEYLGVDIDSGQILQPDEFISTYDRNQLATRLSTQFLSRSQELQDALQHLHSCDILIVSGQAGVGKSRFALECCHSYINLYPEYKPYCIYNFDREIFPDLCVYFSEPQKYIILVDDANRIPAFEYLIQLILEQRIGRQIKIVVTVRDYAYQAILDLIESRVPFSTISLLPFDDKVIAQLVEAEYRIQNYFYHERINQISNGNPRLAMMAASVASKANALDSIHDASSLYDKYFEWIVQDIKELKNLNLLKVAGVVSFFRVIDLSNEKQLQLIEQAFDITATTLRENIRTLYEREILDVYEGEIIRISDQILSTYIIYLLFFKEKIFSFFSLLKFFFLSENLSDVLNSILQSFSNDTLLENLRISVDAFWKLQVNQNDPKLLFRIIEQFWFVDEVKFLLFIKKYIDGLEAESADVSSINFTSSSDIRQYPILSSLRVFRYAGSTDFQASLDLLLDYCKKMPTYIPQVLHILTNSYGIKHQSYLYDYRVEQAVVNTVWNRANNGEHYLFSMLFIAIAKDFLQTRFVDNAYRGKNTFTTITFYLPPSANALRNYLWVHLFILFKKQKYNDSIIRLLYEYSDDIFNGEKEVIENDAKYLTVFMENEFSPENFQHCIVVNKILKSFNRHGISYSSDISKEFSSKVFIDYILLKYNYDEMSDMGIKAGAYKDYKMQRIYQSFSHFDFTDYKLFIDRYTIITQEELLTKSEIGDIQESVDAIFEELARTNSNLFLQVIRYNISLDNPLRLNPYRITNLLIEMYGITTTYELISLCSHTIREEWLLYYYCHIPTEAITTNHVDQLYALYRTASILPGRIGFLLNYLQADSKIIYNIVSILLDRLDENNFDAAKAFQEAFYIHQDTNRTILDCLIKHPNLLKKIYLANLEVNSDIDYENEVFSIILSIDSLFIAEYIDWRYQQQKRISVYTENRHYSFLWLHEDYEELLFKAIDRIYEWDQNDQSFYLESLLDVIFRIHSDRDIGKHDEIRTRQDEILCKLIERSNTNSSYMEFLFKTISEFAPDRRRSLIEFFLKKNRCFADFEKIRLMPNNTSASNSFVPAYTEKMDYLISLSDIVSSIELIEHRHYIQQKIQHMKGLIESAKRDDFMRRY